MLSELGYAVAKRSSWIAHNKSSWVSLERSHVWDGLEQEECGNQWYGELTFICFCRRLPLRAKPDTPVSNITQWPESLCHFVPYDYES